MPEEHDHKIAKRAKLFALHQQLLSAGKINARMMMPRRVVLDDATAQAIQAAAIASLRNQTLDKDR